MVLPPFARRQLWRLIVTHRVPVAVLSAMPDTVIGYHGVQFLLDMGISMRHELKLSVCFLLPNFS